MGVLRAVTKQLRIDERMLEIQIYRGQREIRETTESARAAGFTQTMSDERRVRLAAAAGDRDTRRRATLTVLLTPDLLDEIEAQESVRAVVPRVSVSTAVRFGNRSQQASLTGILPDGARWKSFLVAGEPLQADRPKSVLVSELLLYRLGIAEESDVAATVQRTLSIEHRERNPRVADRFGFVDVVVRRSVFAVGRQATGFAASSLAVAACEVTRQSGLSEPNAQAIQLERYTISGVFRRPSEEECDADPRATLLRRFDLIMPIAAARGEWERIPGNLEAGFGTATAVANDAENVEKVVETLVDYDLRFRSAADIVGRIRSALLLITLAITAVAAAAFAIAALGMTNTMVMNVLERRREIGILKALGARDKDVMSMFLTEGALVGLMGGLGGLALGWAIAHFCTGTIRQILEARLREPVREPLFSFPWWLIVATPLFATLVTVLATLIPARRAAAVDPVETLRSE